MENKLYAEARSFLREIIPEAMGALGAEDDMVIALRWNYVMISLSDDGVSREDLNEAVELSEELAPMARRVYGPAHPHTENFSNGLQYARSKLASFDDGDATTTDGDSEFATDSEPEATASESDSDDANPFGGLEESDSSDGDASA